MIIRKQMSILLEIKNFNYAVQMCWCASQWCSKTYDIRAKVGYLWFHEISAIKPYILSCSLVKPASMKKTTQPGNIKQHKAPLVVGSIEFFIVF